MLVSNFTYDHGALGSSCSLVDIVVIFFLSSNVYCGMVLDAFAFSIHDVVKGSDDERYGFNRNCDSSHENSLCEEGEIMCTTLFRVF